MLNFTIYLKTIIYSALYHKRKAQPTGKISLTQNELSNYYNLVVKDINDEMLLANSFSYQIKTDGEPVYSLNLSPKMQQLVKQANFVYDAKTQTYTSDSSLEALKTKSVLAYPQSLGHSFVPSGYEKSLNIEIKSKTNKNEEPEPNA